MRVTYVSYVQPRAAAGPVDLLTGGVEAPGRTRVVIADDTADVRALLRYTLELDGRFQVVAQAADGLEAIAAVQEEQPDAVVLDLAMPVVDGLEAIGGILAASPATKIVVLSGFAADDMAREAMDRGAHVYLQKGATFSELAAVLAELCPPWRAPSAPHPHRAAAALRIAAMTASMPTLAVVAAPSAEPRRLADLDAATAPGSPDASAAYDATQSLRERERSMRIARWVGMLFAVVQFGVYVPPDGVATPFSDVLAGTVVVAVLVAMNRASIRISRRGSESALVRLATIGLVVDAAVVMSLVWLFTFDASSALWALLVIPVLEGAIRAQMRGAVLMWGAVGVGYVVRELWGASAFGHDFALDSITYRLGIVLLVALTTGDLARSYATHAEQHRQARAESEHRAGLLQLVAASGRAMASLEADKLLDAVVDAALALGFEGVELCIYDEPTGTWFGTRHRGLPDGYGEQRRPITAGLAGAVRGQRETLVVDDYSSWAGALDECRSAGFRSTVGTPIRAGDDVVAALLVGTTRPVAVARHEIECLELLAAQAGVGLSNIRLLEQIRHQAMHDSLTGLPNQLLFEDRVAQALSQSGRSGERVGVLFIDLDRFKKVNDSLGHDFGNELLKQVAGRLLGAVRKGDTVARMGGDEFTLLLPGIRRDEDATLTAGKLLDAFRAPFRVADHELFITPSVGIALYPNDGLRYETLLKHADIAMYRAKARGGNGYELYGPRAGDAAYPRLALEADLHNAVDNDELRVVYQPIVDLATSAVVGVEALVRWQHRTLGVIRPDEFIPLAEEAGLVVAIDTWVLRTACEQARAWRDAGLGALRVSVNMSGRHLQHPRMAVTVIEAIRESGLDPAQLELEVTESVAVAETGDTREALDGLRELGVSIAIDDFGTGYSMLSRLRQFPLDTLKVDRSFVNEIVTAEDEAPIVAATIAMAHSLGLQVVAEGVETEAQLSYLRRHRCDLAQGYLLGRPQAAADVTALVAAATPTTA
ncbi:MAG: EAL domain-containing protein [Actinobacteria bacterium]|nr:EAL domain-containing protein [Actinomycetota bacterium]